MAFAWFWIETLAIGLLWVAMLAAVIQRARLSIVRGVLYLPLLAPLLPCVAVLVVAVVFDARASSRAGLTYSIALVVCFVIGTLLLTWRALWRKRPLWHPAATAIALVLAVGATWMTLHHIDRSARARGAAESARANAAYLAALPPMRFDSDNAAPLYEQAFALLSADEPKEVDNPPEGNHDVFDPHEPATHAYLDRIRPALELLRAAATRPACRFAEDDREPSLDQLPKLSAERHAANVLWLHAEQATADGDVAGAMLDIGSIFRLSRHVSQRPMLVSGLVAVGINALGRKALLETLPAVRSAEDLAPLHPNQWASLTETLPQVLRGEERLGLALLDGPAAGALFNGPAGGALFNIGSPATGPNGPLIARALFCDPDPYIDLMHRLQAVSTRRYVDVKPTLTALETSRNSRGVLVSILVPSVIRVLEVYARADTDDAVSKTAVAMTRYRLEHGKLPAELSLLTSTDLPALPIDPVDGQPIRMVLRGEDRLIYSIGVDGVDDGGAELVKDRGDIGFLLRSRVAPAASTTQTSPSSPLP